MRALINLFSEITVGDRGTGVRGRGLGIRRRGRGGGRAGRGRGRGQAGRGGGSDWGGRGRGGRRGGSRERHDAEMSQQRGIYIYQYL